MSYEITEQSLRDNSASFMVEGEFCIDVVYNLVKPYRSTTPVELFLFMNNSTLRLYQNYFKNLGSTTGFEFLEMNVGGMDFTVDKVDFGNITLISLAPDIFNHPRYYKSSDIPANNEIFVVTNENIKPFVKIIKTLEKQSKIKESK
jgi:hypothetical protein